MFTILMEKKKTVKNESHSTFLWPAAKYDPKELMSSSKASDLWTMVMEKGELSKVFLLLTLY